MSQLVFIHGPGAGACADAYYYQRRRFPDSVAPNLPGHLEGTRCPDVARYTEWVRGWLWAQGLNQDLVLSGTRWARRSRCSTASTIRMK